MKPALPSILRLALDRIAGLGETSHMSRLIKKFIAVFIALWLPLFSGNMMAMPVFMLNGGTVDHSVVAQHDSTDADSPHHMAAATGHCAMHDDSDSSASGQSHPDTGCKHPAACQLVVAAGQVEIALLALSEFEISYTDSFESHSAAPLDPPPLARV